MGLTQAQTWTDWPAGHLAQLGVLGTLEFVVHRAVRLYSSVAPWQRAFCEDAPRQLTERVQAGTADSESCLYYGRHPKFSLSLSLR